MLPLAPIVFPLTCPPVRPRGVGAVCADADEVAALQRLENELEVQVCVQDVCALFFYIDAALSSPSFVFLSPFFLSYGLLGTLNE